MARARNIKPALFKNEILGVADPFLTLLFESLWCLADREGRLEDRPLRIKAETFPYRENMDVNVYLTELERLEFICRYVVDGVAVIQVENFLKHQNPHKTEKASELPEKPMKSDGCLLTVKEPLNNGSCPADSLLLIPDSLVLINSASAPETQAPKEKKEALATRLQNDWVPSDDNKLFCKTERPDISIDATANQFRDYWIAKPGKDGRKLDWDAVWRNWVRSARSSGIRASPTKPEKFDPTAYVNRNRISQ